MFCFVLSGGGGGGGVATVSNFEKREGQGVLNLPAHQIKDLPSSGSHFRNRASIQVYRYTFDLCTLASVTNLFPVLLPPKKRMGEGGRLLNVYDTIKIDHKN